MGVSADGCIQRLTTAIDMYPPADTILVTVVRPVYSGVYPLADTTID